MGRSLPGEFEQVVLLVLAGFEGEATGREVYDVITSQTGRDVSVAAVHITLGRLDEKGWAQASTHDPEPGEGGKPRRRYQISDDGARLLADQRRQLDRLWGRAVHPLLEAE